MRPSRSRPAPPIQRRTAAPPPSAGAARTLRGLCTPATLTGGLTELAWVGAHALLYPLGTRTEQLRPDPERVRPEWQPPAVRALLRRRPAGRPGAGAPGARPGRQPVDLHRDAPRPAPSRLLLGLHLELQPAAAATSRVAADQLGAHLERICEQTGHDRVHVVGHSLGGLIARYLRAAAGRRPPGRLAGHPRHAARRLAVGARAAHPAGPPAAAGLAAAPRARPSRRRAATPRSPPSTATSTSWCCPSSSRPVRPPGPACPQRAGPRRGAHVAADPPRRRRRGGRHPRRPPRVERTSDDPGAPPSPEPGRSSARSTGCSATVSDCRVATALRDRL